ncbi:MAG: HDOD domain-containing protein, partial [Gammaproteobacteria bacterium]|nr:HDOD domain-containing protein [Gammaproteobacteria bacterium]
MSIQQAQLWLKNHTDSIPAIRFNHLNIIKYLEDESSSKDIVLSAIADPGLSLALLKKVNASRGTHSAKDSVESTKSAIALLGDKVTHTLLTECEVAEDKLDQPHQLFLFQQIINRSFHNELQVTKWAEQNGYQNIEQLTSSALLNYAGEILCCVHDFEHYLEYIRAGSIEGDEKNYFE